MSKKDLPHFRWPDPQADFVGADQPFEQIVAVSDGIEFIHPEDPEATI
jgi:hypothetical protein